MRTRSPQFKGVINIVGGGGGGGGGDDDSGVGKLPHKVMLFVDNEHKKDTLCRL